MSETRLTICANCQQRKECTRRRVKRAWSWFCLACRQSYNPNLKTQPEQNQ